MQARIEGFIVEHYLDPAENVAVVQVAGQVTGDPELGGGREPGGGGVCGGAGTACGEPAEEMCASSAPHA